MKPILYEQLPPELFQLFSSMKDEITELKRMIQEGEIGVAISEAEFNLLKGRVGTLEGQMTTIQNALNDLSIDPAVVNEMGSKIADMLGTIAELTSFDTNSASALNAAVNRLTAIETKQVTMSANNLTLPSSTKTNLQLVAIDDYLSTVVWSSSNPNIISQNGVVRQPSASEGNMNVVLTATITYGSAETTKTFIINVPAADMTDEERLDVVAQNFDYSVFAGSEVEDGIWITENQVLPLEVDNVIVSWNSSNEGVVSNDGIVTRSLDGDETVYLTATLNFNGIAKQITFTLFVEKAEGVIPDPINYEPMFAGFSVTPTDNSISVQTTFGYIDTDVLTTETLDARVSAISKQPLEDSHEIQISFDGQALGTFMITGDELNEGRLLSSILNSDPVLLSQHISDDVDLWVITFNKLSEEKEIKIELMVNDVAIREEVVLITVSEEPTPPTNPEPEEPVVDPEPEPIEPEPIETKPIEPETTEPVDEPAPTEPKEEVTPEETP